MTSSNRQRCVIPDNVLMRPPTVYFSLRKGLLGSSPNKMAELVAQICQAIINLFPNGFISINTTILISVAAPDGLLRASLHL